MILSIQGFSTIPMTGPVLMGDNDIKLNENNPALEALVLRLAKSRANSAKWDINILVFLFFILLIVIIMTSLNIDILFTAPVALIGLVLVLVFGHRKSKSLVTSYYTEELENLKQESNITANNKSIKLITDREKEVLSYVANGFSNKMIASQLGISQSTVKIYVSRVMEKLEANDRTEAVVIAIRNGIISI